MAHWSSCAVYNEPAFPNGPCNCGNDAPGNYRPEFIVCNATFYEEFRYGVSNALWAGIFKRARRHLVGIGA